MPAAQPPTAHRLTCLEPESCPCLAHRDPHDYVACCPRHHHPLAPSELEPSRGFCPACEQAGVHAHHDPITWAWLHVDTFDADDLPPVNGWKNLPHPDPHVVTFALDNDRQRLDEAVLALHYSDIPVREVIRHVAPTTRQEPTR